MQNSSKKERYDKYLKILNKKFKIKKFKAQQIEIIDAVIHKKKDVFCVMSTGYGKSLCYQLPALVTKKICIIVSPLISLMEDQKKELKNAGINACCYNSTLENKKEIRKEILEHKYHLVYIAPETIVKIQGFLTKINNVIGITLIAVDEAHCVSMWGNTFRAEYRKLGQIKEWFPETPLIALTGTATKRVEDDIIQNLKLRQVLIVRLPCDRPNLYFHVDFRIDPQIDFEKHFGKNVPTRNDPTIIYCCTRKDTETYAKLIHDTFEIKAQPIHAGLDAETRSSRQQKFMIGKVTCIVATICFGLGINKKDIRKIIHYGMPQDIEEYYQQIGRAGRDGLKSECYVYYKKGDFTRKSKLISQDSLSSKEKQRAMFRLREMSNYLTATSCRRKILLKYFGEEIKEKNPKCCDICNLSHTTKEYYDFMKPARLVLTLADGMKGRYGIGNLVKIIRGSKSKKICHKIGSVSSPKIVSNVNNIICSNIFDRCFGKGKKYSDKYWQGVFNTLIQHGFLNEETLTSSNFNGSVIKIGMPGLKWLLKQDPNKKLILPLSASIKNELSPENLIICDINGNVITKKPEIVNRRNYAHKSNLETIYDLFQQQKKTLMEIAHSRQILYPEIVEHISHCIRQKKLLDYDRIGLTKSQYNEIIQKIMLPPFEGNFDGNIELLSKLCGDDFTQSQIILAIAILETDSTLVNKLAD